MSRYREIGEAIDLIAGLVPNGSVLACGDPALMLRTVVNEVNALRARVAELENSAQSIDSLYRMEAQADRTRREFFNEELLAGQEAIARVTELEEQSDSLTAKLDDRQEALAAIADGVDNPFYDPEAIGFGLEDRGLTDRYEAAEYGWTCCQEAYRSWIEGLTAALLPSGDDGVSE